jgi:hypothetical protein
VEHAVAGHGVRPASPLKFPGGAAARRRKRTPSFGRQAGGGLRFDDGEPRIAHNEVLITDRNSVVLGSFNFSAVRSRGAQDPTCSAELGACHAIVAF